MSAQVTKASLLAMQVCVPQEWTDYEAWQFAEKQNPAGTENGWFMRHTGDKNLAGADERVPCKERPGYVHIMFDC